MTEENSKVFQKRDRLYAVLKNASLDVQHAENLWMIEERLKKIDTLQKAKDYGVQQEKHPLRALLKPAEEAEELAERFNAMADEEMQEMVDRIGNRIDEMLDEANSQDQFEVIKPSFVEEYTEEVVEMALNTDVSEPNLQLFFDMLNLDMEDKIQEHEMGAAENEDANMDFLNPSHVKTLMLVKIRAFGQMIKETRDRTVELYRVRKQSREDDSASQGSVPEDLMMVDEAEELKQIAEESKEAIVPEAPPTTEEQKQGEGE